MNRRDFLQTLPAFAAAFALPSCTVKSREDAAHAAEVMTVRGRIRAADMGVTLTHEHLLANFQPFEEWQRQPLKYDRDEVVRLVIPRLTQIRELGCRTFVDATAVGLGRDAVLLRQLSELSGLHILTTTGNYAANQYRQLPKHVYTDSPQALAAAWVYEWHNGIDGTQIRPGFIKLGFNGGPLSAVEQTLIRAGAIAHRETGLTLGAHTGPATAAFEQLAILESAGIHPSAWIWIHAQMEADRTRHVEAARRGAWVSFDGVRPESIGQHVEMVVNLRDRGLLHRALVSQDAGWYAVGEPGGGNFRPYDTVFTSFIPALSAKGFTPTEIDTLFVQNPADAFAIGVRIAG
jgi:phosphotriesterase-related protein